MEIRFSKGFISCIIGWVCSIAFVAADFDPYQLNGGLVSAVAGRNYVVIATDTRLVGDSGYDILTRNHVSSRIWTAVDTNSPDSSTSNDVTKAMFSKDGSIAVDFPDAKFAQLNSHNTLLSKQTLPSSPVLIGSSGCSADCEMLKRNIRSDLRAAKYFTQCTAQVGEVALLLSQMLYSRRGFPYYSFCVTAGLNDKDEGHVFVYDAIGSYEQVAVAATGSGRELLQPILDRKFRAIVADKADRLQKWGNIPSFQVDATKEDAISILLEGYRAVSEREISVGDAVVFCILEKQKDGQVECQLWSAPLKKQ
jgi:20S proteasome subunit beta 6